ncbi:hypothetical protein EJB05_42180, partial [Eragrostis curvula]
MPCTEAEQKNDSNKMKARTSASVIPGMLFSPIFLRASLDTAGGLLRPMLLLNSLAIDSPSIDSKEKGLLPGTSSSTSPPERSSSNPDGSSSSSNAPTSSSSSDTPKSNFLSPLPPLRGRRLSVFPPLLPRSCLLPESPNPTASSSLSSSSSKSLPLPLLGGIPDILPPRPRLPLGDPNPTASSSSSSSSSKSLPLPLLCGIPDILPPRPRLPLGDPNPATSSSSSSSKSLSLPLLWEKPDILPPRPRPPLEDLNPTSSSKSLNLPPLRGTPDALPPRPRCPLGPLNPASSSKPFPRPPLRENPDDLSPRPRLPLPEPNPESPSSSSRSLLITLPLRSKPRLSPRKSSPPNLDFWKDPLESLPPRPPLEAAAGLREDAASPSSPLLRPRWKLSVLRSLTQSLRSASSSITLLAAPTAEREREENKRKERGPAAPFRGGSG